MRNIEILFGMDRIHLLLMGFHSDQTLLLQIPPVAWWRSGLEQRTDARRVDVLSGGNVNLSRGHYGAFFWRHRDYFEYDDGR